jgi:hypothetical protein
MLAFKPILVVETSAARLYDTEREAFRDLVRTGLVAPPIIIGRHRRFRTADLERAAQAERSGD